MKTFAFVDESGNEGMDLDKGSVSPFYVVCALIVKETDFARVAEKFEEVRERYFRTKEMKSSSLYDENKRQLVIQELAGAEFGLHLLVGKKDLIDGPGMRYPKTFIKVLNRAVYSSVLKDHPDLIVQADNVKDHSFMVEFDRYLNKTCQRTLFSNWTLDFVDSRKSVCVQAADVIAGTVRLCFERNEQTAMLDPLIEKLRRRILAWLPYPALRGCYLAPRVEFDLDDALIEECAATDAAEFVRANQDSDDSDRELQVECLKLLLNPVKPGSDGWVTTEELKARLEMAALDEVNEQKVRHVVGTLRQDGIMIVSRTTWGYKLAAGKAELTEFLNRQNSQVIPMLDRIAKIRSVVRRATEGRVDILDAPAHSRLRAAVEAMPHWTESALVNALGSDAQSSDARQVAQIAGDLAALVGDVTASSVGAAPAH